jgi:hypothetical protein
MKIIKLLLPLTFATLFFATPEKSGKDTVKKTGLSHKEFTKLTKVKNDIQDCRLTQGSLRSVCIDFQQCQVACISYAFQLQQGNVSQLEKPSMPQVFTTLLATPNKEKDNVMALSDELLRLNCDDKK